MPDDLYDNTRNNLLESLSKHVKDKPPTSFKEYKEYLDLLTKIQPKEEPEDTEDPLSVELKTMIDGMTAKLETQELSDLRAENEILQTEVERLKAKLEAIEGA